jgi:RNA polymerase sigma factor (sigma-70 family)
MTAARTYDNEKLATLLGRAQQGDREAFAGIVEACAPMVNSVASRYLTRRVDIEDVVQEVWLALAQNLHKIAKPQALGGWLATVTTRMAWRDGQRRRRMVPTPYTSDLAADDDTEEEAAQCLFTTDVGQKVRAALGRLGAQDRQLLCLLSQHDKPDYRAVSVATNRPVGSIGPTRQRAMTRLRHDPAIRGLALADAG